ncbi:MAG: arsenate reductase [Pararhodobacter sp.]|nr:arsenate reductase [Pararhodobacter sp.]
MPLTILGLKNCDNCRKARKALPDAAFRDLREAPLNAGEITQLLQAFGEPLINRASTTWRGLDEAARGASPAELLATYPALMKRPVILGGDDGPLLGWNASTRGALGQT